MSNSSRAGINGHKAVKIGRDESFKSGFSVQAKRPEKKSHCKSSKSFCEEESSWVGSVMAWKMDCNDLIEEIVGGCCCCKNCRMWMPSDVMVVVDAIVDCIVETVGDSVANEAIVV